MTSEPSSNTSTPAKSASRTRIIVGFVILALVVIITAILAFSSGRDEEKTATSTPPVAEVDENTEREDIIGYSEKGRPINSRIFGDGERNVVFIGGIHGGYEWNTVLLSYELIDYLDQNPDVVPDNLTVTVVPVMNPDGLEVVVGSAERFAYSDVPAESETIPGRFNANGVDLNRNFDCDWQPESTWRGQTVPAGSQAFSETEAHALRQFTLKNKPSAIIFFHSAAGAVYASSCDGEVAPETKKLMNVYANAANYRAEESFDHYEINGDAGDWLSTIDVPSISVELTNHEDVEWERNKAGVEAVLRHFSELDAIK